MKYIKYFSAVVVALSLHVSSTNASPVAIESLFVDTASVSLSFNTYSLYNFSSSFSPIEITMGEYQDPIVHFSSGIKYLDVYTTGAYGASAPSGVVDGTLIDVDLSSLRVELGVTFFGRSAAIFDTGLWPLNTPSDAGVYDPLTGEYSLSWIYNFNIDNPGLRNDYSGDFVVQIDGYLTTAVVPVPAALWLFGSGLLALGGFIRGRK